MAIVNYTGNKIEADCAARRIRFYNDESNFGIVEFDVVRSKHLPVGISIICKGNMDRPKPDVVYTIIADEVDDPKWGLQYNIRSMYTPVDMTKKENVDNFMREVLSDKELENAYKVFNNPYEVFEEGVIETIAMIKGIGLKTAVDKLGKFNEKKKYLKLYAELAEFNITENMLEKLKDAYGENPDLIVKIIKDNPYVMAKDVYGIGFKKCDMIALDGGMNPHSPKRVAAFINHYLTQCADGGLSWITADHLLGGIIDNLGEDIPDSAITEAIHSMDKELWYNDDHTEIGLKRFYNLEYRIAGELHRLVTAESDIYNDNWIDSVRKIERLNGWEFTDEQLTAVEIGNSSNVFVLTGSAGSGKSSTVQAIYQANKGARLLQTALSGRAASKLFEITGQEGSTIHRALGFPKGDEKHGGFVFNQENQLEVDIVIVDEVSMIGGGLFLSLLKAIPDGTKVILLGDTGQLPAIGNCNILNDIIASGEIPTINLTKIHRQAAKSAIISESLKVRNGVQLIPKDWVGQETRGELQDLNIECFSDKSNTFYKAVERFNIEMSKPNFNIMDCQVLCPIKTRGDCCTQKLNDTIQEIYNPPNKDKREYRVNRGGTLFIFREGDKVINTQNNYKTKDIEGNKCPIYNGSVGIIKEIYPSYMIVDFAYIGEVVLGAEKNGDSRAGLELGYALSVHKSQGSGYHTVILAFDYGSYALLSKELIYTGITRAEKMCYIICQNSSLRYATAQNAIVNKQTFLQGCLHDVFHPQLVF